MTARSARSSTLASLANLSSACLSSMTSQRRSLPAVAATGVVLVLLGVSVAGRAQTGAQPASATDAAAATVNVPPAAPSLGTRHFRNDRFKNDRFRNDPAAWGQFLAQWKQRSASSAPHKTKAAPAFGGTWQLGPAVTNGTPICNPLLLTDATVIAIDCSPSLSGEWYKLTPDITGSYVNGTWTEIATLPVFYNVDGWVEIQYSPLNFASAVLPDGRVIVMGGEYNGPYDGLPVGAIYDPVANTWTPVSAPPGTGWYYPLAIGDAQSTVLADGTFLLAACCADDPDLDALFDATNLTWTSTGAPNAGSNFQDEQGYTLLPNGNVLTVDIWTGCSGPGSCTGPDPTNAEQYNPTTSTWSSAGNSVVSLVDPYACGNYEIGPAPLRPDGTVVQFGGNTGCTGDADPTGIYDSTTGVWSAGPNVPEVCGSNGTTQCDLADAPAAVLPNGNILFAADTGAFEKPTHFFEFTTLNAINQVADDAGASFAAASQYNFLVLPNGQILTTIGVAQPEFYTPTGSPDPSWAPVISTSPSSVYPGTTYTITGTQLNGLTQGAYYGDDFQMATNYPIVQITNAATGHVFYGRTFNVSNRSVAPGVSVSTDFTVPANIELGASSLVVIANGIPSAAVPVGVGYPLTTAASPANGGTVAPASGTYYAPNTVVHLTATANAGYMFSGWTGNVANASSASTTVTMSGPQSVTANFVATTVNVTVGTSPAGLAFSVDGTSYSSPQMFTWNIGDQHTIATTETQIDPSGTQERFAGWTDGGSISHTVTVSAGRTSYTAGFSASYLLTTAANPANGGSVSPQSGSYYFADAYVFLTATANAGYAFSSWTGNVDSAGSASTAVQMNGPESVTANFVPVGVTVSPSSLNFGTVYLGTHHSLTATLTNASGGNLNLTGCSVTLGTADAAAYTFLCPVTPGPWLPGKTRTVAVYLNADAPGTLTATLNVTDTAAGSPQQIGLTANVIDPVAQFNPHIATFTPQKVNTPATMAVQLTNTGQTALTVGAMNITGGGAANFSQTNNCPASLGAGGSCTLEVNFTPAVVGPSTATLTLSDNVFGGVTIWTWEGTGSEKGREELEAVNN